MNMPRTLVAILLVLFSITCTVFCWTDEDLELFDLVESTHTNFYTIFGVDQKASASDIRKAYRRLSTLHHPDKSKDPDAEEKFRKIAAIADVLRNEEQRKKYDVILQTGLPDWRMPIYYYRRVRNMGLFDLIIFLFVLATVAQYLFMWSAYWEKKYEIEELFVSRMRRKAKNQRKNKNVKSCDETDAVANAVISDLPKPRCQDLFPVQLVYLLIHCVKSTPSYLMCSIEFIKDCLQRRAVEEEEDIDESEQYERKVRQRTKKHIKPQYPEMEDAANDEHQNDRISQTENGGLHSHKTNNPSSTQGTETDLAEFKKAMKKFPDGTLQRWERISEYLNCSRSEVISMAKQLKSQQFVRNVPISAQGVTGFEDNLGDMSFMQDGKTEHSVENGISHTKQNGTSHLPYTNGSVQQRSSAVNGISNGGHVEKVWKQEEQRLLEIALKKFPKDTPARWDCIAEFVQSKTKEECITRYKELAQQIKQKKNKEN